MAVTEEKRGDKTLTNAEFEAIATRAAEIVEQRMYAAVGRGVVSKALYVLGAGTIALASWLHGAGKLKFPWG